MAEQVVAGDITVPAGTLATAPVSLVIPNTPGWISLVRLTIPPGHNAVTGWALQLAGTRIVPFAGGQWVIGNDQSLAWDIGRWVNPGQLVVLAFNTGIFPHTFRALFDWDATAPTLGVTADLVAPSAAVDATSLAVASLVGPAPDITAAEQVPAGVS